MIKFYENREKKVTTAVVDDCALDAINKITKVLNGQNGGFPFADCVDVPFIESAKMNEKYTAVVECDDRDTYSVQVGKSEATKKVLENHNKAFKRAILRWQKRMLKFIKDVQPETYEKAINSLK